MIRQILFLLFIGGVFLSGCNQKQEEESKKEQNQAPPKIEFEKMYYDFGTISMGEKVSFTFKFENKGGADLIIKDAYASCGCTVAEYDKKPIKPGKSGGVEVVFDSRGRRGVQHKTVILETNTPVGKKTLTIKANIVNN